MIVHLLIFMAVSRAAQAGEFEKCPDDTACLYYARCPDPSQTDAQNNLATVTSTDFKDWSTASCSAHTPDMTELLIRPINAHKWEITLRYTKKTVGITFGDSLLTINANEEAATFKPPTAAKSSEFPFKRNGKTVSFTLASDKKLIDIFRNQSLSYTEERVPSGYWTKAHRSSLLSKIGKITGCDVSLITDECTNQVAQNCTSLTKTKHNAICPVHKMWMKDDNSKWVGLRSVDCHYDTIDWSLKKENDENVPAPKGGLKIRCADEKPEPTPTDSTTAQPSTVSNDAKGMHPTFIIPVLIFFAWF